MLSRDLTELSKDELLEVVHLMFGSILVHYGMWFTHAVSQCGVDSTLKIDDKVLPTYTKIMLKRLAPHLGLTLQGDDLAVLCDKGEEDLIAMIRDMAKTWLAGDGVWFQGVESEFGMQTAKGINDACWFEFAQYEAFRLKKLLGPEEDPMKTLEAALRLRPYSAMNGYNVERESENTLTFEMDGCRVQIARRRKGLQDYPCKSGGLVEYTQFARQIDPRITTECVWCPPENVPENRFCKWRFTIG
jgi:hypothetical protein